MTNRPPHRYRGDRPMTRHLARPDQLLERVAAVPFGATCGRGRRGTSQPGVGTGVAREERPSDGADAKGDTSDPTPREQRPPSNGGSADRRDDDEREADRPLRQRLGSSR